jgi:hypothetical protein
VRSSTGMTYLRGLNGNLPARKRVRRRYGPTQTKRKLPTHLTTATRYIRRAADSVEIVSQYVPAPVSSWEELPWSTYGHAAQRSDDNAALTWRDRTGTTVSNAMQETWRSCDAPTTTLDACSTSQYRHPRHASIRLEPSFQHPGRSSPQMLRAKPANCMNLSGLPATRESRKCINTK